jgi:hypothetical protein
MEENKKMFVFNNLNCIKDQTEKDTNNVAIISINYSQKDKKTTVEPQRIKRIITLSHKWIFNENDLTNENQINIIKKIYSYLKEPTLDTNDVNCNFVIQQLKNKLYSYKSQDNEKKKFDSKKFVNMNYVIDILLQSNLKCYYCNNDVKILYEIVRDPKQWTLDRLNNDYGHNIENVVISCLKCNICKKIINPNRYVETKKCINVIKIN